MHQGFEAFLPPPPIEANQPQFDPERYEGERGSVGRSLRAWQFAFHEARAAEREQRHTPLDRQATATAAQIAQRLGISRLVQQPDYGLVERLVKDDTFPESGLLAQFLAYQIWLQQVRTQGGEGYESFREDVQPLVEASLATTAAEDGQEACSNVRAAMELLVTAREKDIALSAVLQEGVSPKTRLRLAVELMNVAGVVAVIEDLLPYIEERSDIAELVATIQGGKGKELMSSLSSVYQAIEFQNYALHHEELTQKETAMLQEVVSSQAALRGVPPEEIRIADIGAGTGRLAFALDDAGFDVTAFEFEEKHVEYMKQEKPELEVVQADWHAMPLGEALENKHGVDVFYCLGRTVLHNNTPEKMARFFDEMNRITKDGGVGLIDIPDIPQDSGETNDEYAQNIQEYATHLESLGVLPQVAKNLYDGPDESHRYNRMALTGEQFRSYAQLFGFTVEELTRDSVGTDGSFNNVYYELTKISDFDITDMPPREILNSLYSVGLYRPGVDYNRIVHAWGAPLGAPFAFSSELRSYIGFYRKALAEGRSIPPIRVDAHEDKLTFRASLDFG